MKSFCVCLQIFAVLLLIGFNLSCFAWTSEIRPERGDEEKSRSEEEEETRSQQLRILTKRQIARQSPNHKPSVFVASSEPGDNYTGSDYYSDTLTETEPDNGTASTPPMLDYEANEEPELEPVAIGNPIRPSRQSSPTTTTTNPLPTTTMAATPPTFNLNMGADRITIKAHQEIKMRPTTINYEDGNAEASKNIELVNGDKGGSIINERRQDLLYPTASIVQDQRMLAHQTSYNQDSSNQQDYQQQQNICYTPMALLIVILITMLITIVVCFCTHILVRHFTRHQFDLIEKSKQFNIKHGASGYLQQQQQQLDRPSTAAATTNLQSAPDNNGNRTSDKQYMLSSLFKSKNESKFMREKGEIVGGCAFDNPYFRDENYLRSQHHLAGTKNAGLLMTNRQETAAFEPEEEQQLDFIGNHISNLHNKQVTSSVKELTIFNGNSNVPSEVLKSEANQQQVVVDLTSDEQRAQILANPKEGDLIAVDITGHDFMGLGFDVCGDAQDGIFIKSVLARGPARESNCIHEGDKIKCLNISFDNITLQDAYDILNCGAPYKMRLLLEKQSAIRRQLNKFRSTLLLRETSKPFVGASTNSTKPVKSYIKRLTKLMSPNALDENRTTNLMETTHSPANQQQFAPIYLGSLAARQHLTQPTTQALNESYNQAEDDLISERILDCRREKTFKTYSVEESDNSLEYQNQNVNHRLHGPQVHKNSTQLHYSTLSEKEPFACELKAKQQSKSHLEQTQSQPAIDNLELNNDKQIISSTTCYNEPNLSVKQLLNSMSTPTINLLTSSSDDLLKQAASSKEEEQIESNAQNQTTGKRSLVKANKDYEDKEMTIKIRDDE